MDEPQKLHSVLPSVIPPKSKNNICSICYHSKLYIELSKIKNYEIKQFINKNGLNDSDLETMVKPCNCKGESHKICILLNIIYNLEVKCPHCNSLYNISITKEVNNLQRIKYIFLFIILFIFHIALYGLVVIIILSKFLAGVKKIFNIDEKLFHMHFFMAIGIFVFNTLLLIFSLTRFLKLLFIEMNDFYIDIGNESNGKEEKILLSELYDYYKWLHKKNIKLLIYKKQELMYLAKGIGYIHKDYQKFKKEDDEKFFRDEEEGKLVYKSEKKNKNLLGEDKMGQSGGNKSGIGENEDFDEDGEKNNNNEYSTSNNKNEEKMINTNAVDLGNSNNNNINKNDSTENSKANYIYNKLNGLNNNNGNINGGEEEKEWQGGEEKKDDGNINKKNYFNNLNLNEEEKNKDNVNLIINAENNNSDNIVIKIHTQKSNKSKKSIKNEEKKNDGIYDEKNNKNNNNDEQENTSRGEKNSNKMILVVKDNKNRGVTATEGCDDKTGLINNEEQPKTFATKISMSDKNFVSGEAVFLPYHNNGK